MPKKKMRSRRWLAVRVTDCDSLYNMIVAQNAQRADIDLAECFRALVFFLVNFCNTLASVVSCFRGIHHADNTVGMKELLFWRDHPV